MYKREWTDYDAVKTTKQVYKIKKRLKLYTTMMTFLMEYCWRLDLLPSAVAKKNDVSESGYVDAWYPTLHFQ
jgi:hypothetical protein